MTDQEKNKVLARWAGFEPQASTDSPNALAPDIYWIHREAQETFGDLPDLLHSLDALFKWVVPQLEWAIRMEVLRGWIDSTHHTGESLAEAILSLIGEDDE